MKLKFSVKRLVIPLILAALLAALIFLTTRPAAMGKPDQPDAAEPMTTPTLSAGVGIKTDIPAFEGELMIVSSDHRQVILASAAGNRQIQISEDEASTPALSHDGRKIAYISPMGVLQVYDLTTQKTSPVPDIVAGAASQMQWSADDQRLAYGCFSTETHAEEVCIYDFATGTSEVYTNTLELMGVTSVELYDGITLGGWSADGKKMVLLLTIDPTPGLEYKHYALGTILILDLETKEVKTVFTEEKGAERMHVCCTVISPDGKTILFSAKSGNYNAIYRINVDGSGLERVTPASYHFDIIYPVWSPDGKAFAAYISQKDQTELSGPAIFSLSGELLDQLMIPDANNITYWIDPAR
jgi:Tol biopolymer transport system component